MVPTPPRDFKDNAHHQHPAEDDSLLYDQTVGVPPAPKATEPTQQSPQTPSAGSEKTLLANQSADAHNGSLGDLANDGRYSELKILGQGGMGRVVLAMDHRLGRKVAIKRIIERHEILEQRFLREARTMAALSHPNLVNIFDCGVDNQGLYLVMEFIEGQSLHDLIKTSGPIPIHRLIPLSIGIAKGLSAAHRAGIIHRDLKPLNIMVNSEHEPKVLDFGLAKQSQGESDGLSISGRAMGTPAYMPPEQYIDSSRVDHRADIWSFGATLYHAATGKAPKVIKAEDIPSAIRPIVLRCMEEKANDRYSSMESVIAALRGAMQKPPQAASSGQGPQSAAPNHSSHAGPSLSTPLKIGLAVGGCILLIIIITLASRPGPTNTYYLNNSSPARSSESRQRSSQAPAETASPAPIIRPPVVDLRSGGISDALTAAEESPGLLLDPPSERATADAAGGLTLEPPNFQADDDLTNSDDTKGPVGILASEAVENEQDNTSRSPAASTDLPPPRFAESTNQAPRSSEGIVAPPPSDDDPLPPGGIVAPPPQE